MDNAKDEHMRYSFSSGEELNLSQLFLSAWKVVQKSSPIVAKAIAQEWQSQKESLKLIASENYSSPAVQLAMGNWMTDKYAEGSVGRRFYAGCQQVDAIEREGVCLLRELFGCEHASLQPHSGSDANLIAFWAILSEKVQHPYLEKLQKKQLDLLSDQEYEKLREFFYRQKLLAPSLPSGGHLTHGFRANVSGKMFQTITYEVNSESGRFDYAALQKLACRERPLILLAGYSSYPRRLNFRILREIADESGAVLMVDMAHFAGLVAGKVLIDEEDPVPYADIVTSTTHKTLRGPRGGIILCTEQYAPWIDRACPLVMGGPLPHVMAAKVIAFQEALSLSFRLYTQRVVDNARVLAEAFLQRGRELLTGGTENHLLILNVWNSYGLTGKEAESLLSEGGIITNRNAIPQDVHPPWHASGIRMGTAALTTLGMGEEEMREIAHYADQLLTRGDIASVVQGVRELMARFPLYPHLAPLEGLS